MGGRGPPVSSRHPGCPAAKTLTYSPGRDKVDWTMKHEGGGTVGRDHRIRLNQSIDKRADRSARSAAAAEKSAVISLAFFSNTNRVLRVW